MVNTSHEIVLVTYYNASCHQPFRMRERTYAVHTVLLGQYNRRWANIRYTLGQFLVFDARTSVQLFLTLL